MELQKRLEQLLQENGLTEVSSVVSTKATGEHYLKLTPPIASCWNHWRSQSEFPECYKWIRSTLLLDFCITIETNEKDSGFCLVEVHSTKETKKTLFQIPAIVVPVQRDLQLLLQKRICQAVEMYCLLNQFLSCLNCLFGTLGPATTSILNMNRHDQSKQYVVLTAQYGLKSGEEPEFSVFLHLKPCDWPVCLVEVQTSEKTSKARDFTKEFESKLFFGKSHQMCHPTIEGFCARVKSILLPVVKPIKELLPGINVSFTCSSSFLQGNGVSTSKSTDARLSQNEELNLRSISDQHSMAGLDFDHNRDSGPASECIVQPRCSTSREESTKSALQRKGV